MRLIAALDENIPCWPEKHHRAGRIDDSTHKLDRDLANLAREAGGHIAVAEAYRKLSHDLHRQLTMADFIRMLRRVRRTVVEFDDPDIPVVRLRRLNVWNSLLAPSWPERQTSTAGKIRSPAIEQFGTKSVFSNREALGRR